MPKDLVRNEEGWKKVTQKGKGNEKHIPCWESFAGGQRKGRGKRKKSATLRQKGLIKAGPIIYKQLGQLFGRGQEKGGGKLRKIPNWECYKG